MEWTKKYNSFNSWKGLTYYENYKQIMKWMDGEGTLPAPVECNLDPYALCNLNCYFCIGQRYLKHNRKEIGDMTMLPKEYIYRLIDFLANWGVRGLCISGGGEPTLHPDMPEIIKYASTKMDVALVTNATALYGELARSVMKCRWVALSVDAADELTYKKIKGSDKFRQVIAHIGQLGTLRKMTKSKVDLCYKFLILPENQHQIYDACKLAKSLGVQDFHVRPVDFERNDIKGANKLKLDKELILREFDLCHKEETEDFHVYTVTHKFDSEFHVKHDFTRCLATPLVIPILTDGNAYLCVDHKMKAKYRLGSCYPNPEDILTWWGSIEHRKMIENVNIKECSRCTWSQYNQQMEGVVLDDGMCLSFP